MKLKETNRVMETENMRHFSRSAVANLIRMLSLCVLVALSAPVWAQGDGTPYRIVVPTTAGGPLDVVGRVLAAALAKNLKETVVVENRPGASAIIGTDYVAKAAPDGRTLLLASGFVVTNPLLYKVNFDWQRELRSVIELSQAGMILATRRDLDARNPADLRRVAELQPGGLNCAAPPGEMALACDQLKQVLGGAVVPVPYPGVAPAMNALSGGQVDVMFAPFDSVVPQLDGKRIVALANAGTRTAMAPLDGLPLLKDTWPGFTVIGFLGILAPAGTPTETVNRLNAEFNRILVDPKVREFLLARGSRPQENGPEKLAATLAERAEHYRRLASQIGLKPQQ